MDPARPRAQAIAIRGQHIVAVGADGGKLADLVLFSRNLMEIPAADIPSAEVLLTLVGGQIVYRR